MIPDGWTETTLAEIADVIDCKHRTPSYADSGIPLISPGNISWGKLDLDNCKHVIHDDYVGLMDHCRVDLGDLVMGRNQSFGVASYVYNDKIFALGQDTILIKSRKCNPKFLYQTIQSPLFQEQINRLSSGSTFKRINLKDIRSLRVLAPNLDCQIKIAEILGVWDEAIDLLERLIGKKRSRKQGLMQQLLTGKKRFKEFEGSEWKTRKLKDIGKIVSGGTPDTNNPQYWNGDIPWCTPSEITALKDRYIQFTGRTISNEGVKSSSTAIIPSNSLLVCTRATLGYSAINTIPMCTNQGFKSLIPNNIVSVEFLYYKLHLEKSQLLRLASGSTFLEISKKDFEMIEIKIPPLPEQEKIAAVLSAADEEISTLEKQLAAYKQQKLGLMQQLLTGRIRI